jgi:hypothetical protein
MPMMDGIALALAAKRDFPDLDDPPHDGLRRSARARQGASVDRGRRADEAVLARRDALTVARVLASEGPAAAS